MRPGSPGGAEPPNRPAGLHGSRALFLLAAAVVLGVVLLQAFDKSSDPFAQAVRSTAPRTTTTVRVVRPGRLPATTLPVASTLPPRLPSDVKVLAANGTNLQGVGGRAKDVLTRAGYNTLSATNTPKPVESSSVQFAPGRETDARAVAGLLGLPESAVQPLASPPPVPDTRPYDVLVVVGPDLASRIGTAGSGSGSGTGSGTGTGTGSGSGSTQTTVGTVRRTTATTAGRSLPISPSTTR